MSAAAPLAIRRERALRANAETLFQARTRAAIRALREGIQVAPLARAIETYGTSAALPMLPLLLFAARLKRDVMRTFRNTYEAAGDHAAEALKATLVGKDVSFRTRVTSWGFDVLNPRGLRFLEQYGAERVRQITEGTRDAMRTLLADMYHQGVPPLKQAQRIKALVGLTDQHAKAVENLRSTLVDQGVGAARVDVLVARKVKELTELRALNIARTESAFASAAATREARQQAAEDGLFEPANARRVWRTSEDEATCPACSPMDGQESDGIDGTFTTGDGDQVADPPVHVNCRCETELVI